LCAEGHPQTTRFGAVLRRRVMTRLPDPADIQRGLTIALFVAATWSSPPSSPTPEQRPTASRCYASRAIAAAFAPAKLNYDILGNAVPHLHTHIAPRYADDPRPGWPFPFPGTEPPMPEDQFDAPQAQYHPPRVDSPHRRNASQGSSGHALTSAMSGSSTGHTASL
jgi:hypothetical protein